MPPNKPNRRAARKIAGVRRVEKSKSKGVSTANVRIKMEAQADLFEANAVELFPNKMIKVESPPPAPHADLFQANVVLPTIPLSVNKPPLPGTSTKRPPVNVIPNDTSRVPTPIDTAIHALFSLLQFIRLNNADFHLLTFSPAFQETMSLDLVPFGSARLQIRPILAAAIEVLSTFDPPKHSGFVPLLITGDKKTYSKEWEPLVREALRLVKDNQSWARHGYIHGLRLHPYVLPPPLTVLKVVKDYLAYSWDTKKSELGNDVKMAEADTLLLGTEDEMGDDGSSIEDGEVLASAKRRKITRAGAFQLIGAADNDNWKSQGDDWSSPTKPLPRWQSLPARVPASPAVPLQQPELDAEDETVQKTLDKIEKWADLWLAGKLSDDEDWATLKFCYTIP